MNSGTKNPASGIFIFFLMVWGCLNLLQARLTPLNNDEAYYWMYSRFPDWGFFDHPPMIALMIKAGYSLFQNELGVRLLSVISNILTLLIIWNLTDKEFRNKTVNVVFIVIVTAALPAFTVYGFIATPDSPLLLFSAVFLLAYREFTKEDKLSNALFLGFSMAALMYSKYHGALLILLVILSNLQLFKSRSFYIALLFAVILFIPHLYWQYSNGIPSLKYHLVERVNSFEADHVPDYFLNMLLMHNPLILPVGLWVIFRTRSVNKFDKALRYTIAGFFLFFFAATFRYHIQAQWTSLVSIPLSILLFKSISPRSAAGRYLKWVSLFTIPVFLFARSAFMFDFLPVSYLKTEFHNNKIWAEEIEKIAAGRPAVFTNSYQNASVYSFYTGKFAHSLNNLAYRKNQYDLWDFEEQLHGKEILYLPHFMTDQLRMNLSANVLPWGDTLFWMVIKDFQSLQRECVILESDRYSFVRSDTNTLPVEIYNPYPFPLNLKHKVLPVVFQLAFIRDGYMEIKKNIELPEEFAVLNPGDTIRTRYRFTLEDLPPGKYKIAVCSETGLLYDTYNSKFREAIVTE